MRLSLALSFAVTSLFVTSAALACGGASNVIVEQPVIVAQESASQLLVRARALETRAAAFEQKGRTAGAQATRRSAEARRLRLIAADLEGFERHNLLARAGELDLSADQARDLEQSSHARGRQLRAEARVLRQRATALNGGSWQQRRRPVRAVTTI